MAIKLQNNAESLLDAPLGTSDTVIEVQTGGGAQFPTLISGDYFYATLSGVDGAREIVKVTARTGDTLTVVRAQEGTTAAGFSSGAKIELRVTAASVRDLVAEHDDASEIAVADAGGYFTATNVEDVLQEIGAGGIELPASNVSVVDSGGYFTATNVEDALQEIASGAVTVTASNVSVVDAGGYFAGTDVESVLQELGASGGSFGVFTFVDNFVGDGVDTTFTLGREPLAQNLIDVYINGVYQDKNTFVFSGTTLIFNNPPPLNAGIEVVTNANITAGAISATNVLYTPAGSGAVATNVQAKLRETVSVQDFGAVGDGVADDTVAIQAAIDFLTPYTTLEFPSGVYVISNTLTISTDNVFIEGNAKILAKAATSFEYMMFATGRKGITVSNLEFDSNKDNRISVQAIRFMGAGFSSCIECNFVNVTARNARGFGGIPGVGLVLAGNSIRCKADGCTLVDMGDIGFAADGIFTSGVQNVISNCVASSGTDTAFVIESSNNSIITGCASYDFGCGAAISNATGLNKFNNVINGLTVTNWNATNTGGVAITVPTSTTGNLFNTVVSNVAMYAETSLGLGTGAAINIRNVGSGKPIGTTISNCRVFNASTQGILVNGEQTIISGCSVRGTTNACIQFQDGSLSNVVTGCSLFGGSFGIITQGNATVTATGNFLFQNNIGMATLNTSTIFGYMNNIQSAVVSNYNGTGFNVVSAVNDDLQINNATGAATSGTIVDKFPIKNLAGTIIGYVPLYNA
jgi:hypothetical protein